MPGSVRPSPPNSRASSPMSQVRMARAVLSSLRAFLLQKLRQTVFMQMCRKSMAE